MRYDRNVLESVLRSFLLSPTHHNREALFARILTFSQVRAKAHLRPFASWWAVNGNGFVVEDLGDYSVLKFLTYVESDKLDQQSWLGNPMANLNRFFKCRALEWVRSEKNRIARQKRVDVSESGWDHVEGNHPSPEHEHFAAEIQTAFDNAVGRLPTVQRVAIVGMRQGKKAGQIAFENGILVSTVYEATRKARSRLRSELIHFNEA